MSSWILSWAIQYAEAFAHRCPVKKVFLKFKKSNWKIPAPEIFLNKSAGLITGSKGNEVGDTGSLSLEKNRVTENDNMQHQLQICWLVLMFPGRLESEQWHDIRQIDRFIKENWSRYKHTLSNQKQLT